MTKMRWLLFLLFLPELVIAQQRNAAEKQQIVNAVGQESTTSSVQTFNERYEGVRGSPFLSDQWANAQVHMANGKVFTQLQLKYDLYNDEVTVKRRDGAEVIPDKNTVHSFSLHPSQPEKLRQFVRVDYLPNDRNFLLISLPKYCTKGRPRWWQSIGKISSGRITGVPIMPIVLTICSEN